MLHSRRVTDLSLSAQAGDGGYGSCGQKLYVGRFALVGLQHAYALLLQDGQEIYFAALSLYEWVSRFAYPRRPTASHAARPQMGSPGPSKHCGECVSIQALGSGVWPPTRHCRRSLTSRLSALILTSRRRDHYSHRPGFLSGLQLCSCVFVSHLRRRELIPLVCRCVRPGPAPRALPLHHRAHLLVHTEISSKRRTSNSGG